MSKSSDTKVINKTFDNNTINLAYDEEINIEKTDGTLNETEAKILKAAESEFMTKGFAGARTTSIAEAAGVTHAMFHYYFRTKEKLFDRIISEKMNMLKSIIFKSFEDIDLPLEDMIRNLINNHLNFISAYPDLPRFMICEIFNNSQRASDFKQKLNTITPNITARLQQKIDEEAAKGKCRKTDVRMLLLDIVSLNIFPYIASPFVNSVLDLNINNSADFLEKRKQENFDTIMRKLKS